jgi:hypothetical protein
MLIKHRIRLIITSNGKDDYSADEFLFTDSYNALMSSGKLAITKN